MRIDINADLGERAEPSPLQSDKDLLGSITSANLACGFHAGNPNLMAIMVEAAVLRGVSVGAHPGLPDRANFGRRPVRLTPDDAYSLVLYQIGALDAFLRRWGKTVAHVKPHGALYSMAEDDPALAQAIAYAVSDFHPQTRLVGLSGGRLVQAGLERRLPIGREVFADRHYLPSGRLVPRDAPDALIDDPRLAARRMTLLLTTGALPACDGTPLALAADTLCLHGDHSGAPERARLLRASLEAAGMVVCAPGLSVPSLKGKDS